MRTIEEIRAELSQYKNYEDVPKELRKKYQEVTLRIAQQEENDIYRRYEITKCIPFDRLQEICDAERLIGKTIYKLTADSPKGYEETVIKSVKLTKNTLKLYAKSIYDDWGNARWEIKLSDVGKTVFLTPEKAEKALKGGAKQ